MSGRLAVSLPGQEAPCQKDGTLIPETFELPLGSRDIRYNSLQVILLCFHKVGPLAEEGRRLNIEPHSLGRLVAWLKKGGRPFIQACDLNKPWPKRAACLTFDDCYTSTLTYGREVLLQQGVTASFYAVSSHVGGASDWDAPDSRPLACWDLLRIAQEEGFEIGCHTATHPKLGELALEAQKHEMQQCSERMRQEGLNPRSFCLPYGSHNQQTPQAIKESGFEVGLALAKRLPKPSDSRLLLPRVVVACSDTPASLAYKLWVKPRLYALIGRL